MRILKLSLLICMQCLYYTRSLQGKSVLELDNSASAAQTIAAAEAGIQLRQLQQHNGPGYAVSRPMFVLFGDSITEFGWAGPSDPGGAATGPGWATQLSQYYSRKADVINRGLSGWNSRWARQVLPATLKELVPAVDSDPAYRKAAAKVPCGTPWLPRLQLLVIWFGANDATLPNGKDGFLAVPLEEYKANLAGMVQAGRAAGVPHMLLITPPAIDEAAWADKTKQKVSDRTNAQYARYAQAVKEVAAQQAVPVLDMYALVSALPADQQRAWSVDGLHPSPAGQKMIYEQVRRALDNWPQFSSLRQWSLPIQWPAYNAINHQQPQKTLNELLEKQRICHT